MQITLCFLAQGYGIPGGRGFACYFNLLSPARCCQYSPELFAVVLPIDTARGARNLVTVALTRAEI